MTIGIIDRGTAGVAIGTTPRLHAFAGRDTMALMARPNVANRLAKPGVRVGRPPSLNRGFVMDTLAESKAALKTPAYAAQSAKATLAPWSIERRSPARTMSSSTFSIVASVTPTFTK